MPVFIQALFCFLNKKEGETRHQAVLPPDIRVEFEHNRYLINLKYQSKLSYRNATLCTYLLCWT